MKQEAVETTSGQEEDTSKCSSQKAKTSHPIEVRSCLARDVSDTPRAASVCTDDPAHHGDKT